MTTPLIDIIGSQPMQLLQRWFADGIAQGVPEPTAMALATATPDGKPSVRIVLCKGITEDGIFLVTNYDSRKGCELAANAACAVVFHWAASGRQVRLEGVAAEAAAADSDAYFAQRARGSQIGAWTSPQSRPISSYPALAEAYAQREAEFAGKPVPRPENWGGYRISVERAEFWLGMPSRLHDRVLCRRLDGQWQSQQLAP